MVNVLILRVLVLDGLIGLYCIILRKIIYVYNMCIQPLHIWRNFSGVTI